MKSKNLLMGIILLFVGVVALLATLNVFDLDWCIVWRLWPILFILFGISILPLKDWLKAVLLLVALALGVLLYQNEAKNYKECYPSEWVNSVHHWHRWLDDIF